MKRDVKVSVIIPVYNAEKYIGQCVDSVLAQTLQEIEVILVNDGSADGTLEIMKKYQKQDSRVRVIDQENQGPAVARNVGLHQSVGEYLAFLDADDFFAPQMLEELYEGCVSNDADVSVVRSKEYDEQTRICSDMKWSIKEEFLPECNPFTYHDIPDHIFNTMKGWAWDKLFSRRMIEEHHLEFQNLRSSEDMLFVYMSLVYAKGIYVIDRELAYHRVNVHTSVSSTREQTWKCFYIALSQMQDDLMAAGIYDEVKKSFINWVAEFTTWQMVTFRDRRVFMEAYALMHEEGLKRFGVMEHGEDYFHVKYEYDFCKFLYEKDWMGCAEAIFRKMDCERDGVVQNLMHERDRYKAECEALRQSTSYRLGQKMLWLPCKILGKE